MNFSDFRFYSICIILIIAIVLTNFALLFSKTGIFKLQSLKKDVYQRQEHVFEQQSINKNLYNEVLSLRDHGNVLESIAREDLGYIKNNETFYILKQ